MVLISDNDKPVPRHPPSAAQRAHIQARNRRREYLRRHASYYSDPEHPLAAPLLHERLVARFSPAPNPRTVEGFARTLEAHLARDTARLAQEQKVADCTTGCAAKDKANKAPALSPQQARDHDALYGPDCLWNEPVDSRERGLELWRSFVTERFIRGADDDFDYSRVDGDDELDVFEQSEAQDCWFDDEEPSWAHQGPVSGQTGIQDF
ncbi:hypothetical protein CDD81_4820 [Ophiocordyceps australis]|uniref:CCD97-like C-terminal domain-containing protein n=1 Tax=Ophiocordyceps australis TaxID=1399860 RepID=A0A2C5Y912_9HYPO|nr:hypothetical protein CDD81_4820 [Ophiocordyceps australis]